MSKTALLAKPAALAPNGNSDQARDLRAAVLQILHEEYGSHSGLWATVAKRAAERIVAALEAMRP